MVTPMRPLTKEERQLLDRLVDRLDDETRQRVTADIGAAQAEVVCKDGSRLLFHLKGYARPPYKGQRPLPVDASVIDADGEHVSIVLYVDENNRLYELELVKFGDADLIAPNWSTLQIS